MTSPLATEIRAYANAIEATEDTHRIIQNLTDLIRLANKHLRLLKGGTWKS